MFDSASIYLVILPGEGGEDSRLFAEQLSGVYRKYANLNGITAEVLDTNKKRIRIKLSGKDVDSLFKKESGSHRIQRIPPTESRGRVHTSLLNVVIVKELIKNPEAIDVSNCKITYFKSSGKGGQRKNKVCSACRIQYKNYLVTCDDTREQRKNKEIAFFRLKTKISDDFEKKMQERVELEFKKQNQNNGNRGDFHRNYNFIRNEIKQDGKKFNLKKVIRGDLSEIYSGQ